MCLKLCHDAKMTVDSVCVSDVNDFKINILLWIIDHNQCVRSSSYRDIITAWLDYSPHHMEWWKAIVILTVSSATWVVWTQQSHILLMIHMGQAVIKFKAFTELQIKLNFALTFHYKISQCLEIFQLLSHQSLRYGTDYKKPDGFSIWGQ